MTKTVTCQRCNGKGNIKAFSHVEGGVCFSCGGAKVKQVRVKSEATLKREALKREQKEAYHKAVRAENDRKSQKALEIYKDDPYIIKMSSNPMAYLDVIARELAERDGIWASL